jgi:ubiquinone/menaquinone biosynthesis C-methylase UbiE
MYNMIITNLDRNNLLPLKGKILGISGITNFNSLIDKKQSEIIEADYPKVDMQNLPYSENQFNFVISDQVIEHLENPQKAIAESLRVLRNGGIAMHTTCFINYIHCCPKDYWRFSPDALKFLCKNFSEILCSGGWGNRIAILLCMLSDKFRFARIPQNKWSPRNFIATYNEDKYPIVTWIIAKK